MDAAYVTEKLVSWLQEQVKNAGCEGAVFGMSGGLDSSVTAALCKRAFPDKLLGLIMPCYSIKDDEMYARMVSEKFTIPVAVVVLDKAFDALHQVYPASKETSSREKIADANLKSRLRMLTLYFFANKLNYLVIGSSNRDEITVGYFTKYGDGGVDVMPLGNLVKGEMRELARFLGVPSEIIVKPPSPGLWQGQTSEAELGFSYDDVDRYLLTGKVPDDLKKKIQLREKASSHKRSLPPIARF